MPIQSGWYEVGHVYYAECGGNVTHEEVRYATGLLKQSVLPYAPKPIHVILEVSQVKRFNLMLREFSHAVNVLNDIPKHGWAVLVGNTNPLIGFAVKAASHLYHFPVYTCPTVEEGLTYLANMDTSLPPLLPRRGVQWHLPHEREII